ncbi:MAG: PD-(D/E)XK nuclease family protein [bacterium]
MTTSKDIENLNKLLEEFAKLPDKPLKEPTIMEICGYPHYENVCSNILAFFLDPAKEHGLKDLALTSLLECVGQTTCFSNITVEREVITKRGRIDLVINSDECVIAIENKIFHDLINDFADYAQYIEKHAKGKKTILLILRLNVVDCSQHAGFKSISYSDYFAKIKTNIGNYMPRSNNKYLVFLLEYMQSIENLMKGGTAMNKELISFFQSNFGKAEKFIGAWDEMKGELRKKVDQLSEQVNVSAPEGMVTKWKYREMKSLNDALVHDIKADFLFYVGCDIAPNGWRISISERKKRNLDNIGEMLNDIGVGNSKADGVFWVDYEALYDAEIEDVAKELTDLLTKIISKVSTTKGSVEV